MAEQPSPAPTTSAGTTWRAVVMLLCLIALPLLALRGTTMSDLARTVPEVAKRLLDHRGQSNPAIAKESQPEAPRFDPNHRRDSPLGKRDGPTLAGVNTDDDAAGRGSSTSFDSMPRRLVGASSATRAETQPLASGNQIDSSSTHRFNGMTPEQSSAGATQEIRRGSGASGSEPVLSDIAGQQGISEWPETDGPRLRADTRLSATEMPDVRRTSLVPVTRRDRNRATNASYADSPPLQNAVIRPEAKLNSTAASEPPDRFTYVAERLRDLGAVYYLLETWGSERFRFHCKMAIGDNPNYTRQFEATDRDPMQAMGKVLSEVESWRAGR